MSNNDPLTAREFAAYRPHPALVEHIEACRSAFGVPRKDFRIVDWGCGRGAFVLWLRERGYDAVGVDIDPRPFRRGADLFRSAGHRVEDSLFALDSSGRAPLPSGSFHFVSSWQTIEHIADLDAAAAEWRRLTVENGAGFHVYPPHRRLLEPHLFMPAVHWLPKTRGRAALIATFVLLGVEPHWWPNGGIGFREKVRTYYRFSVDDTFYRTQRDVGRSLAAHGFEIEFVDLEAYGPLRRRVKRWLGGRPPPPLLRAWLQDFARDVGLAVVRRGPDAATLPPAGERARAAR